MPSTTLYFRCDTLEHYCPAWSNCVECGTGNLKVKNHVAWALGSTASVFTESIYLSNTTVTTIIVNASCDAGIFDRDLDSYIKVYLYEGNELKYFGRADITGQSPRIIYFYPNIKVNGNVKVKYEVGVRAALGEIAWNFTNPTIVYEVTPPPTTARLKIDTIPVNGAKIYVDGEIKGTSPLTIDLQEGEYTISAELENYRLKGCINSSKTDSSCIVYAPAGTVTNVVLELEQIPAPSPADALLMVLPFLLLISMMAPIMNLVTNLGRRKD